jgi:hypothetical protein
MDDRIYNIRISPEVVNTIYPVNFTGESYDEQYDIIVCCDIITSAETKYVTGVTNTYLSMDEILSGGTNGNSLLTGLTVPILLTETCVDIGYYSVFDGAVLQKDVMTNFLFSSSTVNPYEYYFYNTSDTEFSSFLQFSSYSIDWGDGTPQQTVTSTAPNFYSHTYIQNGTYTITMSGASPWGNNIITKDVYVPFDNVSITNPNGTAYFVPAGGNWSATPLMYDYIYSGDAICDVDVYTSEEFTTLPILITGYTRSSVTDLMVYGPKFALFGGKYKLGQQITGATGLVGTYWGPDPTNTYTGYTINGIDYYDYIDGSTIFIVQSSGLTSDMLVCSALTKNEVLLNVIDEAEIQTDVFIDRGKNSAFESIQRLNEIDNIGGLVQYGYGFFNIINT